MKHFLTGTLDKVITVLLFAVVGLIPLLFSNQMTEFYEMPKLVFLVSSLIVILGLWFLSWIVKGKATLTKTALDIPLVFLLVVIAVSTFFSASRYVSILGNLPTVHGSLVSWIAYIVLYFVSVSHLKSLNQIRGLLYTLFISASFVALISLFSFFGVFLPVDFAKAVNFTSTGSSFSTLAFLLMMLSLPLLSLLKPNKFIPTPLAIVLATLFSVTIVLIGSVTTYVALFLVYGLCLFLSKSYHTKNGLAMIAVPAVITILTLVLAYVPLPGNKIYTLENNFPKEIQLPFGTSWKVVVSVFRDSPFFGTGPSTFLFNFTGYKPAEYNQLKFWNFSFDTAQNELFQVLGTVGGLGLAALLLICFVVIKIGKKNMQVDASEANHETSHVLLPGLAIASFVAIFLFLLHASTLVSLVLTLVIFATFMASQKSVREGVMEFSIGIKATTSNDKQIDLVPILAFILFLIAAVPLVIKLIPIVSADYYHRLALLQANKNGTLAYQYLQKAETLNPFADLYRVDMAQTNFALANALASKATPGADGKPGKELTNQEKQTTQSLLSQAINEGRAAVALSPRSSRNWEVLAAIYRNIAGVAQNALAFSLDAYGRSIQRDPLNPLLRINVGTIYQATKNYDLAIRFFTDAANLKPDYANAYYNLSGAYIGKQDFQSALLVAQQTVKLLEKDKTTGDYKIAAKLLEDLKTKQESIAKEQADEAAKQQPKSAIPPVKISSLDTTPKIATPAAIKTNPNAVLPKVTPQVSPAMIQ